MSAQILLSLSMLAAGGLAQQSYNLSDVGVSCQGGDRNFCNSPDRSFTNPNIFDCCEDDLCSVCHPAGCNQCCEGALKAHYNSPCKPCCEYDIYARKCTDFVGSQECLPGCHLEYVSVSDTIFGPYLPAAVSIQKCVCTNPPPVTPCVPDTPDVDEGCTPVETGFCTPGHAMNTNNIFDCCNDTQCMICHSAGCDQCCDGTFKASYETPCLKCEDFDPNAAHCSDFNGAQQCKQGFQMVQVPLSQTAFAGHGNPTKLLKKCV